MRMRYLYVLMGFMGTQEREPVATGPFGHREQTAACFLGSIRGESLANNF